MTRKKVKLAFITNDSARKATYKKRKRGLLKKMDELTTLCDVKACAVLYSPYESKPVVWPGTSGAREVISSFKRLPEMEKVKKMVSQEEFLRQRVAKAHEQLKRQQKENREKEMTHVMYQCLSGKNLQNMSLLDLSDLGWVINQHLNEISKRIDGLRKETHHYSPDNNNNNNNNNDTAYIDNGGLVQQGVSSEKGEFHDGMHMQMMMQQPWSSFMDMMAAPMMNDHHQQQQQQQQQQMEMGMGMGMGGLGLGNYSISSEENSGATSSSSNNNKMNMMMMKGQFGEYQTHGHLQASNTSLWSNHFFS